MKRIAVMQPYFFPYLGYFQLINAVDKFVVYDDVNFIKKGYINRNNMLVNGKAHLFGIPLKDASQNKKINEIEISGELEWQKNLLKTIALNYKKAPYFTESYALIESIILSDEKNLAKFITHSLEEIARYLNIRTQILLSSEIEKDNSLKGQDKIIEIATKLQANAYINAVGGVELYDKETFGKSDIQLNFIKPETIVYSQKKAEFIPYLSIIDVMMFNSVDVIEQMLLQYELI